VYLVASDYVVRNAFRINPAGPYTRLIVQSARFGTDAYAGFGQATYHFTPALSATAGLRYSRETKHAENGFGLQLTVPYPSAAPFPAFTRLPDASFSAWTPKFGLQWQADPHMLLFASYSKGFKSGGFDVGTANPLPYAPEKLTSYEGGVKSTLAGGHVRANVTGFYYDYSDLQVQQLVGIAVQTSNAASARIYGVEAELNFLIPGGFEIAASGSWTHSRYGRYCGADAARPLIATPATCAGVNGVPPLNEADFQGNQLTNAPSWRGFLSGQYRHSLGSGTLSLRGEVDYSSRVYFTPGNFGFVSQKPFAREDAYITYDSLQFRLFVKNIADVTTKTSVVITTNLVGNTIVGGISPPRTFGGQINYRF
jgi:iron complex outermembrane receptor protein